MRLRRKIGLAVINTFFCGTRFFRIKRNLLKFANIKCGNDIRLVGPIYIGTVANLSIGNNVWIGTKFSIYGNGSVELGNNIDIAPEVAVLTGSHEISDDSMHRAGEGKVCSVRICDGCWIGARTTILGDTIVEAGSVIGACSLINKNVIENSVVAGVPAKIIKSL